MNTKLSVCSGHLSRSRCVSLSITWKCWVSGCWSESSSLIRPSSWFLLSLCVFVSAPADGDEEASGQDRAGVRGPVRAVLVPQPRAVHVPLLPLPPDGSVAGSPRHHPAGQSPQLLLVLRQPLRPLPAERELPPTLQQVRVSGSCSASVHLNLSHW